MENLNIPSLQRLRIELQKRSNLHKAEIDRLKARLSSSEKEIVSLRRGYNIRSSAVALLERAKEELHAKMLDIEGLQRSTKYLETVEALAQLRVVSCALERFKSGTSLESALEVRKEMIDKLSKLSRDLGAVLIATENDFISAVTKRDIVEQQNADLSRKLEAATKSNSQTWLLTRGVFDACFQVGTTGRKATLAETACKLKLHSNQLIDELVRDDLNGRLGALAHKATSAVSPVIFPEMAEFSRMNGMTLRKAVEAAVDHSVGEDFWTGAAARSYKIASTIKYWDCVGIAQSFAAANQSKHEEMFLALADSIRQQMSALAPKHVLDTIAAFEALGQRPKPLYVELFHALLRLTPAMYGEEIAQTAATLARLNINNSQLLSKFGAAIAGNQAQLRFIQSCQVAGSFAALQALDRGLLSVLQMSVTREIQCMRPEEIFENLRGLKDLEFSWQAFELMLRQDGLELYLTSLEGAEEVDQLSSPVDFLLYLRLNRLLSPSVMAAYGRWLKVACLRPDTRMGRRPCAEDVHLVGDLCWELRAGEDDALEALKNFERVVNEDPKPLRYAKTRRYIRADDPLTSANVSVARWPVPRLAVERALRPSPGMYPSGIAAWRNSRLPWYYNR